MAQVVTNENVMDLIQGKSIPEFKPPEAPKEPEVKAESPKEDPPRDEDGKFKAAEVKQEEKAPEKASPDAEDDLSEASEAIRKKIDKLIAKKHRAMKEAEEFGRDEARRALAAEARAEALQREIESLKATKSSGPDPDSDEPKMDDFKTVGEYTKAYAKWEIKQQIEKEKAQLRNDSQQKQEASVREQFGKKVAEYAKTVPDYYDVIGSADVEVPQHVAEHIVDSPVGPALGYFFAKNPEELDRIKALSPTSAAREIGKLEMKLVKADEPAKEQEKPETKPVSKAPPPIQPLEAKTVPVETDPSKMDFRQLRALRESQKRQGQWRA